jgi:hypothetical protein
MSEEETPQETKVEMVELEEIGKMSDESLKQFVIDFVDNKIFVFQDIQESQRQNMLPMVFFAITAIEFSDAAREDVGTIWEYFDKSLPRGVNGYPMFTSLRIMCKADWRRATAAINKILEKRQKANEEIEL